MHEDVVTFRIVLDTPGADWSAISPGAPIAQDRHTEITGVTGNRLRVWRRRLPFRRLDLFPPCKEATDPTKNVVIVELRFLNVRIQRSNFALFSRFLGQ